MKPPEQRRDRACRQRDEEHSTEVRKRQQKNKREKVRDNLTVSEEKKGKRMSVKKNREGGRISETKPVDRIKKMKKNSGCWGKIVSEDREREGDK